MSDPDPGVTGSSGVLGGREIEGGTSGEVDASNRATEAAAGQFDGRRAEWEQGTTA